jgi:hypothetical protein
MSECGFILDGMCCCSDVECYGLKCGYSDASLCPVHLETDNDIESFQHMQETLRLSIEKIKLYKEEVNSLRVQLELQTKLADRLAHCIVECDPWICEHMKGDLKNGC